MFSALVTDDKSCKLCTRNHIKLASVIEHGLASLQWRPSKRYTKSSYQQSRSAVSCRRWLILAQKQRAQIVRQKYLWLKGFRVNKDLLMRFVFRHQTGAIFVAITPAFESHFSKFNGSKDELSCLEIHVVFTWHKGYQTNWNEHVQASSLSSHTILLQWRWLESASRNFVFD